MRVLITGAAGSIGLHFRTDRFDHLLGEPSNSEADLIAHVRALRLG